ETDRYAAFAQFMCKRQPSQTWCAAGRPVLKVKIRMRQRDYVNSGFGHFGDQRSRVRFAAHGKGAAVTGDNTALEAGAQNTFGDQLKPVRGRIEGFINVKINVQAKARSIVEERIQACCSGFAGRNESAQHAFESGDLAATLG